MNILLDMVLGDFQWYRARTKGVWTKIRYQHCFEDKTILWVHREAIADYEIELEREERHEY